MAETRVSVAEARRNLARLIRSAEQGIAVEITRRGEPVSVLLSAAEYLALKGERPSFTEQLQQLRVRLDVDQLDIGDEDFEGLRDPSPGREASF